MDLSTMTAEILSKIPQAMIPTAADGDLIRRYQKFFKQHEEAVVKGFYDVAFSDASTKGHLNPAERPARENTLREWYKITTSGHFDNHYWTWQALVGIVHVKHNIPNSAMLSMWGWIINFLQTRLLEELPAAEALAAIQILQKVQATVCSLIVESFILTQQEAITRASGLKPAIQKRFIYIEIDSMLKQGRATLQANMQQAAA
ncbi:MAG: protoglobin domain-containing protein [Thiothrix sp.]|uniref:protoglobin domain-containing protein n=1 Tax=Thiothrix sp. TaxID=1032 RepID=UPI002638F843|nr:protoglobin domain-containing protein [Thiothrix sp.]MDD5391598.1 protoglobin domain-containing protein [Thiothrix sp.]